MIERLSQRAAESAPADWILAQGARPDGWDDPKWPSRQELDHSCDGRPVIAWCFDYHAMVASSSALNNAKIDQASTFDSGRVVLDDNDEPSGVLLEHAALAMWDAVPEPHDKARIGLVRDACLHLESLGFCQAHDLKAQPWLGAVLSDLHRSREVSLSCRLYPLIKDLRATLAGQSQWNNDAVVLGGGKIFVDGTLNSRTAWMLEPFADGHPDYPCGTPMMSPDQIDRSITICQQHNLPIAAHAIGDGAVRAVFDSIERTGADHSGCRIEHAEVIDEVDIERFRKLGVIASIQPCHLLPDIEALTKAMPDRLHRVLPIRELIESGLTPGQDLIFGSDVPIVRADPQDSIQAAVHRRRVGMDQSQAINLDQAIDEETAWACFED
jgi:predicted amidohydrolase YtcJ